MNEELLKEIRLALQYSAETHTRKSLTRFFKPGEEALTYGVKTAETNKIAKELCKKLKTSPKNEVFNLCDELWKSGYLEEALIACKLSESLKKQYVPDDFKIFEHWVNDCVNNWADCDTLCTKTIGTFVMMYPEFISSLKLWTRSSNRWTRRAAAVTLIYPAKKGLFLDEIFTIADQLLMDKDDMIQKGYGWMLKEASVKNQIEVFDFVISKQKIMPRTALRYAIEKMPTALREEAMKK